MKKIELVLTFVALASAGAAQGQAAKPTPSQEIAKIVAVEEQERDLAKAERLYREALAGTQLSPDARDLASLRLAELLMRLGRRDEAKQVMAALNNGKGAVVGMDDVTPRERQDVEREQALREKARELVKQAVEQRGLSHEKLRWLGEPAVTEIVAYLASLDKTTGYHPDTVSALGSLLWSIGGSKAAAYLRQAKAVPGIGRLLARVANGANSPEMLAVAEEYLRSDDEELGLAVVAPSTGLFRQELLIDAFGKGTARQREWLLRWLVHQDKGDRRKLLGIVGEALSSTEPSLGIAAAQALGSQFFLNDLDAIEFVLDTWLQGNFAAQTQIPSAKLPLDAERARRWVDKLDACQRKLGPWSDRPAQHWLLGILWAASEHVDATVVPLLLRCLDQGYPCVQLLRGKVTAPNAVEVFARFDRVAETEREVFLSLFAEVDLPPELFPELRAKAEALAGANQLIDRIVQAAALTGNPDAAPWLLAGWSRPGAKSTTSENATKWETAMVCLGKRSQHETVRTAMRTMAAQAKGVGQSMLYLALLSAHDTAALTQMTKDMATHGAVAHPYAKDAARLVTPLAYVLHDDPDPPHGFTLAERLAFAQSIAAWEGAIPQGAPSRRLDARRVPTELVLALAQSSGQGWGNPMVSSEWFTWTRVAAKRLAGEAQLDGPLHRWWEQRLQTAPHMVVREELTEGDLMHWRGRFDAMLVGDDPDLAESAFEVLRYKDPPMDFVALTRSKHASVASLALSAAMDAGVLPIADALRAVATMPDQRDSLASYFGAKVAVEAVPALLALLQDKEKHVRDLAAESLTRIRFHHEQQAHWDRVNKGLDASPTAAVEKLLLQGKPGAPKPQRLLAIASLGTLGVPEALPFLIDWTQDADAEVVQKAKEAITQIHLNPRR